MAQDTLAFKIANGNARPNGTAAVMSRTGDGAPRHATWQALDKDYTINFLPGFWVNPPLEGYIVVGKQTMSDEFELSPDAPLGLHEPIAINPPGSGGVPPAIMIQP